MSARGTATLAFAVRSKVVLWLLGQLLMPLAALAAVPLIVALAYGEAGFALRCAAAAGGFAVAGWFLSRLEASADARASEAMTATALVFLVAALGMTWPLSSDKVPLLDAWFESVSAITTTGLSTLGDVQAHSPAFLFTRAWMQWYGGLAIVVLALALVLEPGIAARRLVTGEVEVTDVVGGTRQRARQALVVYLLLTAFAVALLLLAGAAPFDAVVHALAAVSTGGFSSHNDSLAGLGGPRAEVAAIVVSFAGALSVMLYVRLWQGRWRSVLADEDLRALIWVILGGAVLLGLCMVLVGGLSWSAALHHAPLMAASAQTTTGFSTLDVAGLDAGSKLVLSGAMFLGGDAGSTAGGIKIGRLLVLIAVIRIVVLRTRMPPHAIAEPQLYGRRLESPEVYAALSVVFLYVLVNAVSWLLFVAAGQPALDALFEVTSATGTVGLSTGLAGPALATPLKLLLTADMLMGRLEIVALIVLVNPRTWFGRRAEVS